MHKYLGALAEDFQGLLCTQQLLRALHICYHCKSNDEKLQEAHAEVPAKVCLSSKFD